MRITLDIDENLLSQAMALSPGKTKDEVVNEALALYVRTHCREAERCKPDSDDTDN
jgi:hypothetical protein